MKPIIQKLGVLIGVLWVSFSVFAYDFEVDGIYYNIISMADLEVEVTSNGNFNEVYVNGYWSWENTTQYSGHLIIPSTVNYNNRTFEVVGIGKAAFGYPQQYYSGQINYSDADANGIPTSISSITLPNTIRYIDVMAFQGCRIQSIVIPSSVTDIGIAAFAYSSLKSAVLPNSVYNIGRSAFYASSITSLTLGTSLNEISDKAFSRCHSLLEVFCTSKICPPGLNINTFSGSHSALEIYVPSSSVYGFGREYLAFTKSSFDYSGQSHVIEWTNNLKAYKCAIAETDCLTDADAGNHTKMLRAIYSDGVDFTVDIPYDYVINKAPLSLTVNDAERAYGDQNPQFTCSMSGLVNGETEEEQLPKLTFECEATRMSRPGNYRIRAALENPNYDITYKYGTLTVKKAPLSLTVENAEKTYGSPNPEFKYSVSGLKNGETVPQWEKEPVLTSEATATSGVGQYPITAAGGTTANYEVAQSAPGVLTVNPKELTVKADDYERLYNESNPDFTISYEGFVDGDSEESLSEKPTTDCDAVKSSDAGTYPITVSGGNADNYSLTYQNGTLTVNPLTIGFAKTNYTVTYNDMSISNNDEYFNFTPEVTGEYDEKDFRMTLWFLDKDNNYNGHVVATIPDGEFAGNYVENSLTERTWGGKYIFNLVKTSTNPNVVANPDRAYVTVRRASTNLKWLSDEPLVLKSGDRVELGVSYDADFWCSFKTDFDKELISVTSENATEKDAKWYVTGLKEGETTLKFSITCRKNNLGSYDFDDSETITKRIIVEPSAGISEVAEGNGIAVYAENGVVYISKPEASVARVYTLQGVKIAETADEVIDNLAKGLYVVVVDNRSFKISLR